MIKGVEADCEPRLKVTEARRRNRILTQLSATNSLMQVSVPRGVPSASMPCTENISAVKSLATKITGGPNTFFRMAFDEVARGEKKCPFVC
jgi:hypothetical protein